MTYGLRQANMRAPRNTREATSRKISAVPEFSGLAVNAVTFPCTPMKQMLRILAKFAN